MKNAIVTILGFYILISLQAQQSLHISINSLPSNHPVGSDIFIAGTFNGWNPMDEKYKLRKDPNGTYSITITLNEVKGEYKFTRGGWDKAECLADGKFSENRMFNAELESSIENKISGWTDLFAIIPKKSTATAQVKIMDTAFYIPPLNRTRRVWIYLPASYNSSNKKYPVMYIQDGQNVFEDSSSYSGEWGVDEYLDSVKLKECIVVGIDNGADKRLNEYNPYDFSPTSIGINIASGNGEGKQYVDFLAKYLKPFIDKNYRTLKDRKNTFISGSSMGGLISMYAILYCPKVFGGAGVFSPAFWVAPDIFKDISKKGKKVKGKIYFYAGKEESESMVPLMMKAFREMNKVSKANMSMIIRTDGKHNEARWRQEFPLFYDWIIKK